MLTRTDHFWLKRCMELVRQEPARRYQLDQKLAAGETWEELAPFCCEIVQRRSMGPVRRGRVRLAPLPAPRRSKGGSRITSPMVQGARPGRAHARVGLQSVCRGSARRDPPLEELDPPAAA